jgi:hypothetical protein
MRQSNRKRSDIVGKKAIIALLALGLLGAAWAQQDQGCALAKALSADYEREAIPRIVEAATRADPGTASLAKGIALSFLAFYQGGDLIKESSEVCEKLQDSPLGMAVYASCKATKGKYALLAFMKNGDASLAAVASAAVVDANALLDKAVAKAPDDLPVRFLRLLVEVEVARLSPFDLDERSRKDCDFLQAALGARKDLDPAFRAQLWYYVAEYYALTKKVNKAIGCYDKAAREAPGSRAARNADLRLRELEG